MKSYAAAFTCRCSLAALLATSLQLPLDGNLKLATRGAWLQLLLLFLFFFFLLLLVVGGMKISLKHLWAWGWRCRGLGLGFWPDSCSKVVQVI